MAKKEVKATVKLRIPAGQASPSPPVGPALGQHGVNIMDFCKAFNERTKGMEGTIVPAVVTIYKDRTFDFVLKTPPTSFLLKQAAKIAKGSPEPNRIKVGKVTRKQIEEIARIKLPDLNTQDLEKAMKIVEGTARNMGIEVVD
ncbi:MAG: 50S ribosomal protein L11 [Deltaproteobacteria bacterium]|nr:MAG: 50S ribosomal protein L11 [Deltaproteobacteria bacterium]